MNQERIHALLLRVVPVAAPQQDMHHHLIELDLDLWPQTPHCTKLNISLETVWLMQLRVSRPDLHYLVCLVPVVMLVSHQH